MNAKTKGFSLIELMIVIAIIGVLAAIAIPSYQTYIYKSRWAEMRTIAEGWQLKVNDYISESGATDCTNMPVPGNLGDFPTHADGFLVVQHNASPIVEQVSMNGDCRIDILSHTDLFGNNGNDGRTDIYLQATIDQTGITWTCATIAGWAPTSCPFGNGL